VVLLTQTAVVTQLVTLVTLLVTPALLLSGPDRCRGTRCCTPLFRTLSHVLQVVKPSSLTAGCSAAVLLPPSCLYRPLLVSALEPPAIAAVGAPLLLLPLL
jgi:hypothetical protein